RDDSLADDLPLDRAPAERHGHAEADAPLVHAVVRARLEVVADVARFAADAHAGVADLSGQKADADVGDEVRVVLGLDHRVVADRAGAEDHERRGAGARHEAIADVEARAVLIVVGDPGLPGFDQAAERLQLPEPSIRPFTSVRDRKTPAVVAEIAVPVYREVVGQNRQVAFRLGSALRLRNRIGL